MRIAATDPARLRPRVMIYGVGYYGMEAVRILVKHGWPIVAAVNRAGPKIGEDLGRLAGLGEDLGVVVQDCDTADYATLDADRRHRCSARDKVDLSGRSTATVADVPAPCVRRI